MCMHIISLCQLCNCDCDKTFLTTYREMKMHLIFESIKTQDLTIEYWISEHQRTKPYIELKQVFVDFFGRLWRKRQKLNRDCIFTGGF